MNFDKIWHGDLPWPSRLIQQIKFCDLKIRMVAVAIGKNKNSLYLKTVAPISAQF